MPSTSVLIVDDNKAYREAFRRNLALHGYDVKAAEDSLEAMDLLGKSDPDVLVTDLAMRHPTEGLDLIRQVRKVRPHLPIIMISAVGTFDEGAEAMRLGASQVISKSRIDEEMASLYRAIDDASAQYEGVKRTLGELAEAVRSQAADPAKTRDALRALLRKEGVPASVKSEAFDLLAELPGEEPAPPAAAGAPSAPTPELLARVRETLAREIPGFDGLEEETRQNLATAEYLYGQSEAGAPGVDFSRSIGFTYCFAAENEVKSRLRKRLAKFFGDASTVKLIESLLEDNRRNLSVFYQQYLLRAQKGAENEATIENFFHTFQRILEHRGRYKPDGLKALGIVIICFGRAYSFKKFNQEIAIDNPLGVRGLASDADAMKLAGLLINLQHYRNPYIHPEISEMAKVSKIRETALASLRLIAAIE